MRGFYEQVFSLARICAMAAVFTIGTVNGQENQLGTSYNGFAEDSKQRIDAGWVPRIEQVNQQRSIIKQDAPKGELPDKGTYEFQFRESLRRAYQGHFKLPQETDPYSILTEGYLQTTREDGSCSLGDDCLFPKTIHDQGHCRRNICIMISAAWCGPCREMYPVITELRKEGYIIYIFDMSTEEFKNYDAKFNTDSVPTFIVFDKGAEVTRTVGLTKKTWFTEHLKTKDEQLEEDDDDVNPYNRL